MRLWLFGVALGVWSVAGCGSEGFSDTAPGPGLGNDAATESGSDSGKAGADGSPEAAPEATPCPAGSSDCDGDPKNGCEADPSKDALNCGACGNACAGAAHAKGECASAKCTIKCEAGYADCDDDPKNGCEVATTSSALHCASCSNVCTSADHATAKCEASACGWTCNPGRGDCDKGSANGCEVDLNTALADCGACANTCGSANGTASCAAGKCAIECTGTWKDCDGQNPNGCESDTQIDASNCGWCGHSCQGSTCSGGLCAPEKVTTNATWITAFAVHGDDVYFTADLPTKSAVYRVAKAGGSPLSIILTGEAESLVVEDSGIYWVGSSGNVWTAPLAGGAPIQLSGGEANGRRLVLDATRMYWTAGPSSKIYTAAKSGETAMLVATPPSGALGGLVIDDAQAYWTLITMNSLQSAPKVGGTPAVIVGGQDTPQGIVIDETNLYWANYGADTVVSMPKAGGAVTTLAKSPPHPKTVTSDASSVYFETSDGSILGVAKTGGELRLLAQGQNTARFLEVDATHVYWVNNVAPNDVTIWKVAK